MQSFFTATGMTSLKTVTYHSCWENISQGLKERKEEKKKEEMEPLVSRDSSL